MMLPKRPLISAALIASLLTPSAYAQPPKSAQSATTTPPGHPSTPTPAPRVPAPAKPAPPVWRSFHLDPNVRLKLDFRHASADVVIQTLSDASRIPIVKDPDLVGDITLRPPAPVSLDDAFALFEISLHLQHCQLAKSGKFLTVIRLPIVVTAPPSASVHMAAPPAGAMPGMPGMPPGMQGMPGGMSGGMPGMPGGSPPSGGSAKDTEMQFKIYPIKYASATLVAKVINDIYNQTPPPQMPGMPQFQQPQPAGPNDKKVKADGEEYSNSLVVWAPAKDQADIAGFVAQIDKPATEQRTSRVFKLKHALANKVAPIIQSIVDNSNPTGRGHTSPAATQSQNPFVVFFGQGQKQTDNGDVVPDIRTNTLTVTAAVEVLARIDDVLLRKPHQQRQRRGRPHHSAQHQQSTTAHRRPATGPHHANEPAAEQPDYHQWGTQHHTRQ